MRKHPGFLGPIALLFAILSCLPSMAVTKSESAISSFSKYVQIPGATPVGTDACATCHADIAKDFRHAYHAQQGVECEQCHGAGSLHVQGGGDISKIISFRQRSATDSNGVCLGCHARDASIRNWMAGPHASNKVRCTDCHQTHAYGAKSESKVEASLDVMDPGHSTAVENLVPEAKVIMQPRWKANDACLKCHQTERAQISLPYHHPLREGKMSCVRLPRSARRAGGQQPADGECQSALPELPRTVSRAVCLPASSCHGKLHDLPHRPWLTKHESVERERARVVLAMPCGPPQRSRSASARSLHQLSWFDSRHRYTHPERWKQIRRQRAFRPALPAPSTSATAVGPVHSHAVTASAVASVPVPRADLRGGALPAAWGCCLPTLAPLSVGNMSGW